MRQLSTVFGTSELAVATVLAAYMGGLAAGAAIAGRIMHRIRRPVFAYGVLEAAIALSAVAVPFLLQFAGFIYGVVLGGQPEPPDASGIGQSLFYLTAAFIVLAIPTGCMGATLPMLTRYAVRKEDEIGPRVGILYAINTAGAIGGTLSAAFLLLPALGLMGTIVFGAIINLAVFGIAAWLASRMQVHNDKRESTSAPPALRWPPGAWILPVMLVSGVASFCYEVLWTRLLSHILGGSVVAFATMLASFLAGIALGSAIASRLARTREFASVAFVVCQLAIAITSLVIFQSLDRFIPDIAGLAGNVPVAILMLLPATLFIGATYPFAVRIITRSENEAASASARVYAWNTVGAIAGALVAGFFLIPLLRYEGTIKLVIATNLGLALVVALATAQRRKLFASVSAASLAAVVLLFNPASPESLLRVSPLNGLRDGNIRFYDVGRSATVLMLERDGYFYLRTNGLPEASTDMRGSPPSMHSQRLLAALPVLARPQAETMLIAGFGGGVVAENIPSSLVQIDIVELEPKVIEANRAISDERNIDPLLDSRINIVVNDARNALRLTDKTYDIVVSQPSHPWTAGASHLYTQEYMQLVHSRLNPDGVFLQWINVQMLDEALLRSLAATLTGVFPHVRAYHFQMNEVLFLASEQPIEPEAGIATNGEPLSSLREEYLKKGIGSVSDVFAALAWDTAGMRALAADAPPITDNDNRIAMRSMRILEERALSYVELKSLLQEYGPLFDPENEIHQQVRDVADYLHVGDQLADMQAPELVAALSETLNRMGDDRAVLIAARAMQDTGNYRQADRLLLEYLERDPESATAAYLLFSERRDAITQDDSPAAIRKYIDNLSPDAHAVLTTWDSQFSGDYRLARNVDALLATARPEDPWYLRAAKLRAQWRIIAMNDGETGPYGEQALAIIDEAIALHQDIDFYGMRMGAAYFAGDHNAAVETARRMIWMISTNLQLRTQSGREAPSRPEIAALVQRTQSISGGLSAIRDEGNVPAYKLDSVERQARRVMQELEQL